jgi:hypothetical protein
MIIKLTENSVKLCCNGNGCPTVSKLPSGQFMIQDDYGQFVKITEDEILNLSKAAKYILDLDARVGV